jgi:hypothetical protein
VQADLAAQHSVAKGIGERLTENIKEHERQPFVLNVLRKGKEVYGEHSGERWGQCVCVGGRGRGRERERYLKKFKGLLVVRKELLWDF